MFSLSLTGYIDATEIQQSDNEQKYNSQQSNIGHFSSDSCLLWRKALG